MKNIVMSTGLALSILCPLANAGCILPPTLKVGKTYQIQMAGAKFKSAKVIKIHQQSCWIKIKSSASQNNYWVNTRNISTTFETY